jgi:hypothetical protein
MFTVPAAASAMPVPDPVPEVVIRILGKSALYATCQELTSGSSSVLPVSLMLFPDEPAPGAAAGDEVDDDDGGDEFELQAARKASGITAAAVATKRILFPTGEISFAPRTFSCAVRQARCRVR